MWHVNKLLLNSQDGAIKHLTVVRLIWTRRALNELVTKATKFGCFRRDSGTAHWYKHSVCTNAVQVWIQGLVVGSRFAYRWFGFTERAAANKETSCPPRRTIQAPADLSRGTFYHRNLCKCAMVLNLCGKSPVIRLRALNQIHIILLFSTQF
jgi:hypothetical protein